MRHSQGQGKKGGGTSESYELGPRSLTGMTRTKASHILAYARQIGVSTIAHMPSPRVLHR